MPKLQLPQLQCEGIYCSVPHAIRTEKIAGEVVYSVEPRT